MNATQQQQYLNRIDYRGSLAPTLPVLQALQRHHLFAVPFENLDIHLGREITLDIALIFQKIVGQRRGGFCYELNGLFYELLTSLGFQVKRVSSIVMTEQGEWTPEYDHLSLIVSLPEGEFLSDVGFGRFSFLPIQLVHGSVHEDQEGRLWVGEGPANRWMISRWEGTDWKPEFAFSPHAKDFSQFAGRCVYQQKNPASLFLKQRLVTMPGEQGRYTLTDTNFKLTRGSMNLEEAVVEGEEDFQEKLARYFGIRLE